MKAYCFKCKESVEIQLLKRVIMKNGRPALKGSCGKCSTKVFRMIKKGE